MNPTELRAALGLALVFALRMLGLFMVLPVFALYARDLADVTPARLGLALGVYGLTQALLQAPLGLLSDRLGRKPVIAAGLAVFVLGSIIAGAAQDVDWVIIGRALQGVGAVGAAINALLADLTRESERTKAMALVGVCIGLTFLLALVLGPALQGSLGVPGLFYLSAALGVLCVPLLYGWVPVAPPLPVRMEDDVWADVRAVLSDPTLLKLDAGIFIQHALLTALFVAVPIALHDTAGLDQSAHWKIYLPVLLLSLGGSLPLYLLGEQWNRPRLALGLAIGLLAFAHLGLLAFQASAWGIGAMLVLFFAGFNLLEATLPALVSKAAPMARRGTALGVYSSLQFLGIFCGGVLGGVLLGSFGVAGVFASGTVLALLWLALVSRLQAT